MKIRRALPAAFLFLFFPAPFSGAVSVYAAGSDFYTLNQRWEKSAGKPDKAHAVDDAFGAALQSPSSSAPSVTAAPVLQRSLDELAASGRTVELELGQSLLVTPAGAIQKFIATDEGVVSFEASSTSLLRVEGKGLGSTFVHVWDAGGRKTFQVQTKAARTILTADQVRQLERFERARSFKFGYQNARGAFYTAEKPTELQRNTLDYDQIFSLQGDTPYGYFASHLETQKDRRKNLVTDYQASLRDGRIGAFRDFDAAVGDSRVSTDLISFPGSRIRGVDVKHAPAESRAKWRAFTGREQASIIGTLSPGIVSHKQPHSHLSGGVLDYKLNEDARLYGGYFNGYGTSRPDELNRHGGGVKSEIDLGEHVRLVPEVDHDNERFAQRHAAIVSMPGVRLKSEYRNINKEFVTLGGIPSRQGELGYLFDLTANPSEAWNFSSQVDVFRDRVIPNPEDPHRLNLHQDYALTLTPLPRTSAILSFQDFDDTGRLGPTKSRAIGGQLNQGFDLLGHKATVFARLQNRKNRNITNPVSDYVQNQFGLGLYTTLFWDLNFTVQQEWSNLEEPNVRRVTHPYATTYSLDRSWRLWETPLYAEIRMRYRDEEETESPSSFMTGEDSFEINGNFFYRETEDLELFLTSSFRTYRPESLNVTAPRVEAQFLTGMKYVFDTGYHWEAVGSFKGVVFKDLNGDGKRQPEEPGLKGMKIKVAGREILTDDKGMYEVRGVSGKNAVILLEPDNFPQGYVPTTPTQQNLPIEQGATREADFGIVPRSEAGGLVFSDLNGNEKYDPGEPPVKKVRVKLEGGRTTVTNVKGVFAFPDLIAGDHVAELDLATLPEGYLPTGKPKKTFTLFEGMRYELNFPLRAQRTVAGRVFGDKNSNGRLDMDETGLAEVLVLFGGEPVLTDRDGYYLFDNLKSGAFDLAVDPTTVPAGFTPPPPRKVDIPAEPAQILNMDFALPGKKKE
ncbi:MAG TPA: SdrD B-like domain-containing protein [Candidatus Eisenbacteria bacterium]|nr:SdrD B-like domain-containing protein [Candidatus Eisenbacteria bacterium]